MNPSYVVYILSIFKGVVKYRVWKSSAFQTEFWLSRSYATKIHWTIANVHSSSFYTAVYSFRGVALIVCLRAKRLNVYVGENSARGL